MKEKMLINWMRAKKVCRETLKSFMKEEKGASDIVAILLIIVVLIAVAGIFKDQLEAAVESAFGTLMDALQG